MNHEPREFFIGGAAGLLVLLVFVGGFFLLNNYIYNEKQPEPISIEDGEYLGFIRALTDNDTRMDFDDAVWLTGAAAQDAAIAKGVCTEETREECTPNDYFILNETVVTESLLINANPVVVLQTYGMEESGEVASRTVSFEDLAALINDSKRHWNQLPYKVTVEDGVVVRIEEVYIP